MAEYGNPRSKNGALREQVIAMREAGRSNPEIRTALGISGWTLTTLLQGHVEPVHENLANRAKPELRAQARDLREQGWSYDAIARKLRVSKSSLSLWLRDLPKPKRPYPGPVPEETGMTQEEWEEHCRRRNGRYLERKQAERLDAKLEAAAEIGGLTERELLIAGVMIYWCEGSKDKPWRRNEYMKFINSEPAMILLFLRFVEQMGWTRDDLGFRLAIHESADVEAATRFWAELVAVPSDRFSKPTLKKHKSSTVRKRVGEHYKGCLVVSVRRSAALYRRVEGWAQAIMQGTPQAMAELKAAEVRRWNQRTLPDTRHEAGVSEGDR
jgi:transposase